MEEEEEEETTVTVPVPSTRPHLTSARARPRRPAGTPFPAPHLHALVRPRLSTIAMSRELLVLLPRHHAAYI